MRNKRKQEELNSQKRGLNIKVYAIHLSKASKKEQDLILPSCSCLSRSCSNRANLSQDGTMGSFKAADLFAVTGMVFIITGGGSGLGEMMARALDANGAAKVFILGRRKEALKKVASKAASSYPFSA